MTAFLVFTETEPLLVMASRSAVTNGRLAGGLARKGIDRFIAHEVPLENLRSKYGIPFEIIEADIRDGQDIRVLDSKGSHVFSKIRFSDLGRTIQYYPPSNASAAGQHSESHE
jgi:hypothetical protein